MAGLIDARSVKTCLAAHRLIAAADDVEETCTRVGEVFRPHRLGVVGREQRLSARLDHMPVSPASTTTLNLLHYGADVSIASEPFDSFYLVMMPLQGTAEVSSRQQKIVSTPDVASIVGPVAPMSIRWHDDCEQLIVRVDRKMLEDACATHLGHELNRPLEFELGMDLRRQSASSWESVVGFLASSPAFLCSTIAHPLIAAQVQQLLMSALLTGQTHNYLDELLRPSPALAPYYVKRAEEFICAHADQAITVQEVAAHVGVSTRSLHTGFQRYRDTTPMAFLRNVRLERVRLDLLRAKEENRPATVTDVALTWGFSHLGHFTAAYARKFNELPSQTLRCAGLLPASRKKAQ
ncbi:AraC family transcriptional regulator [Aromatoleum bremense]|uniref:Helix-turn-helix domain-containing protein n=1 Tax=Aromatoleum bremense TaxID=76115 RepID=A0ABX1NVU9_9RHOO|nr:AraC family transcriptional regulator [Aromatoleum bremense]NMG15772.1 helix-turn-helix domain-containing protein [Aromatoleum bremense]QTQ30022.1 Transcriptional regulator, AraC-type [Aromatoleum bremense]